MEYELVLPPPMLDALRAHLLRDRTREQYATVLCGRHQRGPHTRLLGRKLILPSPDQFSYRSSTGLMLDQELQAQILSLAAREGLSQIDFHTHPGEGDTVAFSTTDDEHERALARYLAERVPETNLGSVVLNTHAVAARLWANGGGAPRALPLAVPPIHASPAPASAHPVALDTRYDRQIRAFGPQLQRQLAGLGIGLVGCGGLGSICIEELARLGVRRWVLVDPDAVDRTNLNRLLGATPDDAEEEYAKVDVAARVVRTIDPAAEIEALRCSVSAPRALRALTTCDLIIVATDNHSSRLIANALAVQYLIPLVHAGVNLALKPEGGFDDISGEIAIPAFGAWCLACAGIVNSEQAGWELARSHERAQLTARGYLADTPAPAVMHLNGVVASLAVAEIHNLISPYKPSRRWLVYRELETDLMTIEVPPRGDCFHCCSDGRLGLGDLATFWRPSHVEASDVPSAADPVSVR